MQVEDKAENSSENSDSPKLNKSIHFNKLY